MADKKDLIIPPQGSLLRDFIARLKLIWGLMKDARVSPWVKLIPVAGLLYLVWPIDLVSELALPLVGELDDAAVLWLSSYVFMELCPPDVVLQHVKALAAGASKVDTDDVVDAESVEVKDNKN
ncbi:MAG TPA: DUF1232 domain-containing protein [Anaerolineales bacterium]